MASLVLTAQSELNYPLFIFANTGDDSENQGTLDYFRDYAVPFAAKHNIEMITVEKRNKLGVFTTLYESCMSLLNRTIPIPVRMANGAPGNRKCTIDWKIKPVAKETKRRGATKKNPAVVAIGISLDEWHRAQDSRITHQVHEFPLLDRRITRADCANIILDAGLPLPPKSACWFCPYKERRQWELMAEHEPELFELAAQMEDRMNDKRSSWGKDRVWLTDRLKPLREAILPQNQLTLSDIADEECTGYCWT